MKIRELMTDRVLTLDATADIDLAVGILEIMRIRHLPVVQDGRLVGLVTHRDLLAATASSLGDPARDSTVPVRELMRPRPATIHPDADVREAIRVMRHNKYGALPVVDADDTLVGIVTEADFLSLAHYLLNTLDGLDLDALSVAALAQRHDPR
ncbi:MAG: CBS domain-containing protein [Myxococcales bacterium]|nr:CBS domain-containing protein [Myxococcales bacterium]MCB9525489.1 CBS domain-containing protein [Myxococcales bacterium]